MTNNEKNNDILLEERISSIEERLEKIENTIKVSNSIDKDEKQDVDPVSPIQENDTYNKEPEEEEVKDVIDNFNSNSLETNINSFIDTLPLKKEDNLFLAKSVFTEMGFSWNGSTTMKSMPKKFASFKRNVWYLKKEAVIKMLFSSKKKNISSFINNLLEEVCND